MMKRAIVGSVLMLAGCGLQPNYILVMTTFVVNANLLAVGTQTVIQGFRSKEACQFAGDQWRKSPGMPDGSQFVCLEPKP